MRPNWLYVTWFRVWQYKCWIWGIEEDSGLLQIYKQNNWAQFQWVTSFLMLSSFFSTFLRHIYSVNYGRRNAQSALYVLCWHLLFCWVFFHNQVILDSNKNMYYVNTFIRLVHKACGKPLDTTSLYLINETLSAISVQFNIEKSDLCPNCNLSHWASVHDGTFGSSSCKVLLRRWQKKNLKFIKRNRLTVHTLLGSEWTEWFWQA